MQKNAVTESTIKQQRKRSWLSAVAMAQSGARLSLIAGIGITAIAEPILAQAGLPQCQPPRADEYLLLVLTQTPETQEQIRRTLPPNISAPICQYLGDTVTRIGGFRQFDDADSWAKYVNDIVGLTAVVARPTPTAATPTVTRPRQPVPGPRIDNRPPQPSPTPTTRPRPTQPVGVTPRNNRPPVTQETAARAANAPSFNPQPLGEGYAVLVDYLNQPEIASELQQELGKEVGLVVYLGRPYLLAKSTVSQTEANQLMQSLSETGFGSLVVNSSRVTLLTPAVSN
ncbi:MAG: hypothetical protein SAJ37_14765 [Oscillatoria sp. PMC 1068.18]|nr:hypothetical protein [Oscillatoria sp. PMC 1076.18]MEC4989991.1 hypothetical protein [Oscillatoria sp. PMC 1068.18]